MRLLNVCITAARSFLAALDGRQISFRILILRRLYSIFVF